jgi:basic membrane protein A
VALPSDPTGTMSRPDVRRLKITRVLVLLGALVVCGSIASPASPAGPFRIGMVADTTGVYDRSFNQLAYAGVSTAALRLGANILVLASPSVQYYESGLRTLAQQGYDPVIAIGPSEVPALAVVARQYPNVRFAIVNDSYDAPGLGGLPNVLGLVFKQQEAGYLAGYLAGLVELSKTPRLKRGNVISSIGNLADPSVDRYIAGFQAGALAADHKVKLLHASVTGNASIARCHDLAASQIAAGSDIVFPVGGACNAGALKAVDERGVWAIGVDADESYLGPSILASATLHADQAVILAIDAAHDGTFAGGRDVEFGIAQHAAGIAGINAAVPPSIRQRVNALANRVRAGSVSIPTTLVIRR